MGPINKLDKWSDEKVQRLPIGSIINLLTIIGHPVLISFELFVAGTLLIYNDEQSIGWSVLIQIPLLISISLIKIAVRRIRPKKHFQAQILIDTYSFPSGHAYAITIFGGTVFYVLSQLGYQTLANISIPFSLIIIFCVGASRVFIKAHYMSDVLGGLILSAFAILLIYG